MPTDAPDPRARLRTLAAQVTPGPWIAENDAALHDFVDEVDAKYIAACDPQTILSLLDDLARLERERDAALEIVKELAAMKPDFSEADGDMHCFFCYAFIEVGDKHADDCLWMRATKLAEDR